uniref:Bone morphogenetic protein 2-like n=1 Tax=Salarias fasciatus TaxID=181472 RepID=A0A672HHM6_SALFA
MLFPVGLVVFVCSAAARPPQDSSAQPGEVRSAAIKRLLEVFGMEDPPDIHGHKQPPQYMLDLYNAVADVNGVTRDPDLLEGNIVRSFFDKSRSEQVEFRFNLSSVARTEKILVAELHLFKLRPQSTQTVNRHHFCQVSIYQQLSGGHANGTQRQKLLASRLMPVHSSGWEVFHITEAVSSWMMDEGGNIALLVVVQNLAGGPMDKKLVRFASGRSHHQSKQPMMVLFTDDGRRSTIQKNLNDTASSLPQAASPSRSARSLGPAAKDGGSTHCQRRPLFVDFEEIGWSDWIVSPKGYNAYYCKGFCSFPLGQSMVATNHATVQSIINALKLVEGVGMPCCVPDELFSISLLYFDEDENVVLKQYNDMVVGTCGCH